MYFKVEVRLSDDDIRNFLTEEVGYSEEEVEEMTNSTLQSEVREAIHGVLSDHFSDYLVTDNDTLVFGEVETYKPAPSSLDYVLYD